MAARALPPQQGEGAASRVQQVPQDGTQHREVSAVTIEQRFWRKVAQTGNVCECWIWQGSTRDGYGRFWLDGKGVLAHRYSYESSVGPITPGLQADHLCAVRACVNPWHLEVVTGAENTRRAEEHVGNKTHCPK